MRFGFAARPAWVVRLYGIFIASRVMSVRPQAGSPLITRILVGTETLKILFSTCCVVSTPTVTCLKSGLFFTWATFAESPGNTRNGPPAKVAGDAVMLVDRVTLGGS